MPSFPHWIGSAACAAWRCRFARRGEGDGPSAMGRVGALPELLGTEVVAAPRGEGGCWARAAGGATSGAAGGRTSFGVGAVSVARVHSGGAGAGATGRSARRRMPAVVAATTRIAKAPSKRSSLRRPRRADEPPESDRLATGCLRSAFRPAVAAEIGLSTVAGIAGSAIAIEISSESMMLPISVGLVEDAYSMMFGLSAFGRSAVVRSWASKS
jgi:hypothetical protein